ncbi:hypothetical protein KA977_14025, partial [Candidatus Dependentiae bacterium]|nr:hypothetical protein [Candidatus Dependentiae bacterium]
AIDEFDVVYSTNSDGTGDAIGLYKIWRYSDNNPSGLTTEGYRKLGASANGNGNMPFGSGYGSDYNQMGRAEHIVYDKINQCIWVSDMENNRIARYDITYNNSSNLENMIEDLTIENAGDTPNITGYLVYGSNVNYFSSEDQYYCREGMNDTIDILFNKTMSVSDTPVVKLVYEDNYETDVVIHYYSANKLIVLFNIISGHDGIAFFRVSGAKDLFTTGQLNEPDESVKIVVDTQRPEKPVLNISSPYNVTSNPVYPYVTGTVNDRNPLKVSVYTFSNETGSSISYTQQNINLNPDKSFTAISVNLISPSPSENYIGAVCYDKAGNVSETSDLKKINFVNGTPGIASVTPDYDTGYVINTAHSFYIKYTAAENILESCTITFYVPYGWSNPQNVLQTSAGYVNIKDTDSVYNLRINTTSSSDTFFSVTFDSMFSGGYFTLIYGDTLNGNNQNAKTLISNNAVFGQNNFTVIRKKHSSSNEQIQTNDIYVTGQPLRIGFEDKLINTFVFKGQKDVLFGELTFYNDNINKSYKLTSFDIIIKDTQNLGIIPSAVISKLSVKDINASYCLKTSIENSGNKISVVLSENITINPSSSKTVGIYIDIMQTSVSSGFRIFLSDSDSYKVFDAETSGIQLTVSAVNTFDSMYSSACSINSANPATDLYIDYTDYSPDYASYGQAATYIFKLSLSNPVLNSSLIKLKSITFNLTDIAGSGINFSSVINSIALKKSESSLYYSNVSSMPSADSITISLTDFYIQFGDTKYIDLYCTFKNVSAIQSVKFKVSGQSGFNAVDNNLNSGCTVSILPSSSKVFPLISKGTAMQSPNILNKIYTSFDNSQILTGTEFSVNAYFKINSDSAKAVVFPSASDLKFYINNTDSSSEFSILSMSSATVFETGYAGNTITYTCKQNGLSSGNLKVDFIVSKPQGIDFNDYYYGGQSLVLSDSKAYFDTSAVLNIISDSIELVNYSLSNFNVYPDSNGIQVLKFVIKNNQILNDTIVSMIIRKTVSNNGIDTVFVYSDNGNGVYDAADTELANSAFPGNTVSLNINYMIGSLSSKLFFVTVHLSKTLTDGDTFDFEIPANSLYLMSGLTRPATSFNSSGELRAQVSGDRISIYPQEDTVAVGQYVS